MSKKPSALLSDPNPQERGSRCLRFAKLLGELGYSLTVTADTKPLLEQNDPPSEVVDLMQVKLGSFSIVYIGLPKIKREMVKPGMTADAFRELVAICDRRVMLLRDAVRTNLIVASSPMQLDDLGVMLRNAGDGELGKPFRNQLAGHAEAQIALYHNDMSGFHFGGGYDIFLRA